MFRSLIQWTFQAWHVAHPCPGQKHNQREPNVKGSDNCFGLTDRSMTINAIFESQPASHSGSIHCVSCHSSPIAQVDNSPHISKNSAWSALQPEVINLFIYFLSPFGMDCGLACHSEWKSAMKRFISCWLRQYCCSTTLIPAHHTRDARGFKRESLQLDSHKTWQVQLKASA